METINIISWNVNGIRAVAEKGAFDWLQVHQPHILCLQEIKALPDQLPENLFANRYPHMVH
jgi:exodeoxyribonuclease III